MSLDSSLPALLRARIEAIAKAASDWSDPKHPARERAVEATLAAPNRFTEQALAFAINQQMSLLTEAALAAWSEGYWTQPARIVGVLNAGNVPLAGLQDLLAVWLTGHRYLGAVSSKSPHLLPAFVASVQEAAANPLPARFVEAEALWKEAEAVIATGTDETAAWAREQAAAHGIPSGRCLLRGHRFAAAVIDGEETEDEREGLAEDALLHEGYGCRNVAIIWAPEGCSPDPYLEAFARFRGVFPAHEKTPGALQMPQSLLEATDQPHAYAEGLAFLLSRGAPEVQQPGHVRWSEYIALADAETWLIQHADRLQLVVARETLAERLDVPVPIVAPGDAQRPPLDWTPDQQDPRVFLAALD